MKKFICYMLFLLMGINCVSADNFDVNKFVDELPNLNEEGAI